MKKAMMQQGLSHLLKKILRLLKQTEPVKDEYDVTWQGTFFIPQSGRWWPSHFTLYEGHLYCHLEIEGHSYDISWEIDAPALKFDRGFGSLGSYANDEYLWSQALKQIYQRLRSTLRNFDHYNRRVARLLPLACRTGKIQRHYTWGKGMKAALPLRTIQRLERGLRRAAALPKLTQMTLSTYLHVVAITYDAVFKKLHPLSPLEKYRQRADGRHGGLLDLPPDNPRAFAEWYHSKRWSGSHPWEIVFGHPHGIMISPRSDPPSKSWHYTLWVDSLGWYTTAARMALALCKQNIPLEFYQGEKVLDALKGVDDVEVGPSYDAVRWEELKELRPDAIPHIRWDPIPPILPISPGQKKRVEAAEKTVRP